MSLRAISAKESTVFVSTNLLRNKVTECQIGHLEAEFLEEPLVLARLVALLESGLDVGLALALAGGVLNVRYKL